jgi:hypothetical protein
MENFHFTEDEYWKNMDIYKDNLLASETILDEIGRYIETRDPNALSIESENRIARDMFGGYKYGN